MSISGSGTTLSKFFAKPGDESSTSSDEEPKRGSESSASDDKSVDEPKRGLSRFWEEFTDITCIGEGGYGKVYKCRNKLDNMTYAVKEIEFTEEEKERSIREVRTLAMMNHPNVVRYYQAWIDPDSSSSETQTLFIVMELCDKSLSDVLREGIPNDLSWKIFHQIVHGLVHIHHKKVVHRDLSTNNIFMAGQDTIKIGDFGLAKVLESEVASQSLPEAGVALYRAPEMNSYACPKSDIYSLGIIFFELFYPLGGSTSERYTKIDKLRKSKELPKDWGLSDYNYLLQEMISDDVDNRPTAHKLLSMNLPR